MPNAQIAEIVTFRLLPGADETAFLAAARATGALLSEQGGCLSRYLSKGQDGRWTDHVLWSDMASAQGAAAALMQDHRAAPFLAAIDPEGIEMRHETLHWQSL